MPKRRSQSHITPHARPRHPARRTAEYITEQWLAQLSRALPALATRTSPTATASPVRRSRRGSVRSEPAERAALIAELAP
jgi:hypothetical protein